MDVRPRDLIRGPFYVRKA